MPKKVYTGEPDEEYLALARFIMGQKVALWHIYVTGRFGMEQDLGYVIASATDFYWLRKTCYIGCDIVKYL